MPDNDQPHPELTTETVTMPAAGLYVNMDVNDYLASHTEAELFEILGKLKDLLTP